MKHLIHFTLLGLFISVTGLWAQPGQLDTTFADQGILKSWSPLSFKTILPLQNGHSLIIGDHEVNSFRYGVGILDVDPQGDIVRYHSHEYGFGPRKEIWDAVLTSSEKVIGVGWQEDGPDSCTVFFFNSDGFLDSTNAPNGYLNVPFAEIGVKIIVQQDDKYLILGSKGRNEVLIRLTTDFLADSSFGTNGVLDLNRSVSWASQIAQQRDGKILLMSPGFHEFQITRYHGNSQTDIHFGASGHFNMSFVDRISRVKFAIQNSGKIVAMVQADSVTHLVRINPNGTADSTFGTNGVVTIQIPGTVTIGTDMVLQVDGKILIGGNLEDSSKFVSSFWLHRLLSNGIPDYSFEDSAHAISPAPYKYAPVKQLVLQEDGNILLGSISTFDYPHQFADDFFLMTRYISGVNLGMVDFLTPFSQPHIYPNPISANATLTFTLPQAEKLTIELFDLQGKRVKTFYKEKAFPSGKHEIDIRFDDLFSPDYYLLSLMNGKHAFRMKVLKQ